MSAEAAQWPDIGDADHQKLEELRARARDIFSDMLLDRVTAIINTIRSKQMKGYTHNWFKAPDGQDGSGAQAYYTKGSQAMHSNRFVSLQNEARVGCPLLHVFGGDYEHGVDMDFQFLAYRYKNVSDRARYKEEVEFGFWLASNPSNPSRLVLHVFSTEDAMMELAVGALLAVLTYAAGNSKVSSINAKYQMFIEEVSLEFADVSRSWSQTAQEADLNLSQSSKRLIAVVKQLLEANLSVNEAPVIVNVRVKGLRLYNNFLVRRLNRVNTKISEIARKVYKPAEIVRPPFNAQMLWGAVGFHRRQAGFPRWLRRQVSWVAWNM